MTLPQAIRAARGKRSQQAFATEIGASISTLQRWESGERAPVHYRHITALLQNSVPSELLIGKSDHELAV
jgi:DNA-binding transcriptional regulator YiaG